MTSASAPIPRPIRNTARKTSRVPAAVRSRRIPQATATNMHIATRGAKKRSNKYPDSTLPIIRAIPRNEKARATRSGDTPRSLSSGARWSTQPWTLTPTRRIAPTMSQNAGLRRTSRQTTPSSLFCFSAACRAVITPSGNRPISSGDSFRKNATIGTETTRTSSPMTMYVERQPSVAMSLWARAGIRIAPEPIPTIVSPKAKPRRRSNQRVMTLT